MRFIAGPPILHRHGQFLIIFILLLPPPAKSQPATPPPLPPIPSNPYTYAPHINPQVGLFVLVGIVSIFIMTFICVFIRYCRYDVRPNSASPPRPTIIIRRGNRGLNSAAIESFPTFDYSAVKALKIGKGALECAVCLNEFEDAETLRLIPICDHVFHDECIDMWLESHATCPVCRANLVPFPGVSISAPVLGQISGGRANQNDDAVVDFVEELNEPSPPPRLTRSHTSGNTSGRRRWFGLLGRSLSAGHVAVTHLENMERFTLRLPEEVRKRIMTRNRPAGFSGSYREESSRGRLFGSAGSTGRTGGGS